MPAFHRSGCGTGPGLIVRNEYAPVWKSLAHLPNPATPGSRGDVGAIVGGVVVAAGTVGLPQLDEGIFDVPAVAVEHATFDTDSFADGVWGCQHVVALARQPHGEVRADRL